MQEDSKLQETSAKRASILIATALILSGCSLLPKKDDPSSGDPTVAAASGKPAFSLEVDAPKEVRDILEKHLELRRFQHQPD